MSTQRRWLTYAAVAAVILFVLILGFRAGPGRRPDRSPVPVPGAGVTPPPAAPAEAYKTTFRQWATREQWQPGTPDHVASVNGALVLDARQGAPDASVAAGSFDVGKPFYSGTYITPVVSVATPFNWAVASWDADTPSGTWIQVEIRALRGGAKGSADVADSRFYTKWYSMGVWASGSDVISRHSVDGQGDSDGTVDTDTLKLKNSAVGYQVRATLCTVDAKVTPSIRRLAVVTADENMADTEFPADQRVWGTDIPVPERSQMVYGDVGLGWCSPTSTSMLMEYWARQTKNGALDRSVPDVADACYDSTYNGTGNWPFNTAAAAAYGLEAYVTRMQSISQLEQWIKAGIPVAITISFKNGQLYGAPVGDVPGHLIVVRGFDAQGNVICNDPAIPPPAGTAYTTGSGGSGGQTVRIVYRRDQLQQVWRANHGVVYIMYPKGRAMPPEPRGSWE